MSTERIDVLDGWRGVAILLVLAGHFVPGLGVGSAYNAGRAGVEVFLALSGALIGQLLFVRNMPLRVFAARRFARIVPALWIFLSVATVLFGQRLAPDLANAVGLANFATNPPVLAHLWSVALELQGYIALCGVAWAARSRRIAAPTAILLLVAGMWLLIAVAWVRGSDSYYATYWKPQYRLTAMFLAALFTLRYAAAGKTRGGWILPAVAGLALQATAVPDALKYTFGSGLLAHAAAGLAVGGVRHSSARWLSAPLLVWFGSISYSVYLYQQLFYAARPWTTGANIVAAIAAGWIAHKLWDGPANRHVRRWLESCIVPPQPLAVTPPRNTL